MPVIKPQVHKRIDHYKQRYLNILNNLQFNEPKCDTINDVISLHITRLNKPENANYEEESISPMLDYKETSKRMDKTCQDLSFDRSKNLQTQVYCSGLAPVLVVTNPLERSPL